VIPEICSQTDRHTDVLITILCHCSRGRSNLYLIIGLSVCQRVWPGAWLRADGLVVQATIVQSAIVACKQKTVINRNKKQNKMHTILLPK